MALNRYIGMSQEDLEQALANAQQDSLRGKTSTQNSDGNIMNRSQMSETPDRRIEKILYALYLLNPAKYPIEEITAIRETRVVFGVVDPNQ